MSINNNKKEIDFEQKTKLDEI